MTFSNACSIFGANPNSGSVVKGPNNFIIKKSSIPNVAYHKKLKPLIKILTDYCVLVISNYVTIHRPIAINNMINTGLKVTDRERVIGIVTFDHQGLFCTFIEVKLELLFIMTVGIL